MGLGGVRALPQAAFEGPCSFNGSRIFFFLFFFSFPFQSSSGATQEKKGRPLAHLLCVQCLDLLAGEMVQCGVKHVGSGAWHVPVV